LLALLLLLLLHKVLSE